MFPSVSSPNSPFLDPLATLSLFPFSPFLLYPNHLILLLLNLHLFPIFSLGISERSILLFAEMSGFFEGESFSP